MAHDVRRTASGLVRTDGVGVLRVEERHLRQNHGVQTADLVLRLRIANDSCSVHLRTGSRQGQDIHDGQSLLNRRAFLEVEEVPGVEVHTGSGCNPFGSVDGRAAADSEQHVNLFVLANLGALAD